MTNTVLLSGSGFRWLFWSFDPAGVFRSRGSGRSRDLKGKQSWMRFAYFEEPGASGASAGGCGCAAGSDFCALWCGSDSVDRYGLIGCARYPAIGVLLVFIAVFLAVEMKSLIFG